jgi:two-component SAPR family response regulator
MKAELSAAARNAATFLQGGENLTALLTRWRQGLAGRPGHAVLLMEPRSAVLAAQLPRTIATVCLPPGDAGLLEKPFSLNRVETRVLARMPHEARHRARTLLVVDMDWLLQAASAMANGALWGAFIDRILAAGAMGCLSVYHRRHLAERDLLAGLHAHAAVVSAEGCRLNPYQLPAEASVNSASPHAARMRLDHWLGSLAPSLELKRDLRRGHDEEEEAPLSGGDPHEILSSLQDEGDAARSAATGGARWKVRCFGSMRVYRADGSPIEWHREDGGGRGGSTRKLRGLFAVLLLGAERGASSAELIEVLWPDAKSPEHALNRLHHTVNELRRCLLPALVAPREHPFIVRQDQRYFLRLPPGSWVDVEEFPQVCRQGGDLLRDGRLREALICFESALKLYTGDLFADLPASITEGGDADWCSTPRAWLRELWLKVHGDCARIHRELGNALQAAVHCRALLKHDATSAAAHAELMRLHATQGRRDALDRQFAHYRAALLQAGHGSDDPVPLMDLYVALRQAPGKTLRNPAA